MVTYQQAHDCVEENSNIIGMPVVGMTSNADMLAWNLNAGLLNLTLALQPEFPIWSHFHPLSRQLSRSVSWFIVSDTLREVYPRDA
jgi:hypothetical protein